MHAITDWEHWLDDGAVAREVHILVNYYYTYIHITTTTVLYDGAVSREVHILVNYYYTYIHTTTTI